MMTETGTAWTPNSNLSDQIREVMKDGESRSILTIVDDCANLTGQKTSHSYALSVSKVVGRMLRADEVGRKLITDEYGGVYFYTMRPDEVEPE